MMLKLTLIDADDRDYVMTDVPASFLHEAKAEIKDRADQAGMSRPFRVRMD